MTKKELEINQLINPESENVIEWLSKEKKVTVSLSRGKYANKVRKLAEDYPDEVTIVAENQNGSIVAKLPLNYLHISHPRQGREYTEEEREELRRRLEGARKKRTETM